MSALSQLWQRAAAHRLITTVCLVGLLALISGAVALGTSNNTTSVPPGPTSPTATTIESSDLTAFGILRREQTATDHVPSSAEVVFSGASGANLALARRAEGLTEGEAYVVPGKGSVCLIAGEGAGCTTNAAAAAGKLVLVSGGDKSPGTETIAVLVPDGVSTVSAHLSDGSAQSVAVHENVYLARISGSVTATSFTGPSGPTTDSIAGPPPGITAGG